MNEKIDTDQLNAVWKRIMPCGEGESAAQDEAARLRAFMDDESSDAASYRAMARMCRNPRRAELFRSIAADEEGHLRRLQTAYFLLTGDTYAPKAPQPRIRSMLEAVRARCLGEEEGARAYAQAAETARSPRLAELYRALSQDELRHRRALEGVLAQIMR